MFQRFRLSRILALALTILLAASVLPAQTSRGTVSGVITDPTGAVVANAKVTLIQAATSVTRETATNSAGIYRFDAVSLGTYQIKVAVAGFANAVANGIEVRANQTSAQDFKLEVGTGKEVVEVQADAAAVQLQTDEQLRGSNISARRLADLPISGQNSLNLMTTVAGIIPDGTGVGGGIGSVNGARARSNNFMIDGVENNDISVAGQAVTLYNNDAIQEVSIQTSNFSAEFGRSGGAVINQITKSGTNNLHGTLAWVYLSEVFDASDRSQRYTYSTNKAADPNYSKPLKSKYKENIPAFTIGGPVVIPHVYDGHNKTFWFAAGQWDRYSSGGSQVNFTVPTQAGVDTLKGLAAAGCSNADLYLKALGGLVAPTSSGTLDISIPSSVYSITGSCNGTNRAGVTIPYGRGTRFIPRAIPSNNYQFRVDHVVSEKQNMTFRVLLADESYPNYYTGISRPFDADEKSKDVQIAWTDTYVISNSMTNEFRFSYGRINPQWTVVDATGMGALPTFSYGTLSAFGTDSGYPQGRTANNWQYQDTMTKVTGKHQIRFGVDFLRQLAAQLAPKNVRGAVAYSNSIYSGTTVYGFANFLDDFSGSGSSKVTRVYGLDKYYPNLFRQAYFVQDNWKVTPSLTLNLGVRYENFGQPANGFKYPVVNFDPAGFSTERVKKDNNNFGPSVGFAWNPKADGGVLGALTGNGKMVVRGGYQINYDTWYNNLLSNMAAAMPNNPSSLPVSATINSTYPRGLVGLYKNYFPAMAPAPLNTTADTSSQFPVNMVNPYTQRWSLGIQRELPGGFIMDLSYVGSVSHKLFESLSMNPKLPDATKTNAGARMIPTIGQRSIRSSTGNSNYNSMQLEIKKRSGETPLGVLEFNSAWTWSRNMDTVSETFSTNAGYQYPSGNMLLYGTRNIDYGPSDNDRRHRWVTSFVWDVRGPKQGVLGQIFGGWTVSGTMPLMTGLPYYVYNAWDRDLDGTSGPDRPDISNPNAPFNTRGVPKSTCSTGYWDPYTKLCVDPTQVRFLQVTSYSPINGKTERRNYLTTDGSFLVNANIIKKFTISERMKLEYRAEIFNVLNRENFDFVPAGWSIDTTSQFLDWSKSDAGNRSMRMGLKVIF